MAHHAVVGVWDAALAGGLLGAGFLLTAHAALADRRRVAAIAAGTLVGLALFEIGARTLLPPRPRFPSSAGVHVWLADSIRASRETQGWDMLSREMACTIAYGGAYRGLVDDVGEGGERFPSRYTPRPDALRRELHVGDSMVFGLGVDRGDTFTAALAALEPTTEHVNAGIPGLAPDAYLVILQAWAARQHFDVVTMYLFEGNDLRDLDAPFPCCGFAALLAYDGAAARQRCPTPVAADLDRAGLEWLRYNSPPPYLLRALSDDSAAAAYLGALLVDAGHRHSLTSTAAPEERLQHLGAILRTARDELAARGTVFRVVLLPGRVDAAEERDAAGELDQMIAVARELGIPALDLTPVLRAALQAGRDLFVRPFDPHFSRDGHRLVAEWLHRAWGSPADAAAAGQ
ncbi:MAG: hypothetical protein U0802_18015 [Candidatus Binatia bacterium]